MRYTDALDPLLLLEQELRLKIARRIAEEAGGSSPDTPSEALLAAADDAIEAWQRQGEEELDPRAFRAMGPLQELLANHQEIVERIVEMRDRRLA
ncbi:MAG: hypothetical protein DI527_10210 [Chelatococcus sp.]|nr:MAG: hypothetical protein DI527_10210 [Chelatococcus sp.]